MRIILIDDQKEVLSALQVSLKRHYPDSTFVQAGDLSQMWQAIERECPDLLIVDWGMRGLHEPESPSSTDGENPLQAIRRRCPNLGIIVLDSSPEIETLAINWGADSFVCKADPPETLLMKIRAWQQF